MSPAPRPEAIDSRLVFQIHACITLPAGIVAYMWPLIVSMRMHGTAGFASGRVIAAAVAAAGCCAAGCAAIGVRCRGAWRCSDSRGLTCCSGRCCSFSGSPCCRRRSAIGWPLTHCRSRRSVHYGTQLADALAHAHDRGIVHRDFKTANVIATPHGRVKVLDFGLAKRAIGGDDTAVITRAQPSPTQTGTVLARWRTCRQSSCVVRRPKRPATSGRSWHAARGSWTS